MVYTIRDTNPLSNIIINLPPDLQVERKKQLEDYNNLIQKGFSEEEAIKIIGFLPQKPEISGSTPNDVLLAHKRNFSFITIGDTNTAALFNSATSKISMYASNGIEPRSGNGNIYYFDPRDDDQPTIAAQLHVTPYTNISVKNIINPVAETLSSRSAIKGRADAVEFKANEIIILKTGDRTRNSSGASTLPGGVHLYAGDNEAKFIPDANKSQPMVLGDNLQETLRQIYKKMDSITESITRLNIEVLTTKGYLAVHFHPPLAPPSPMLAAAFPIDMILSDIDRLMFALEDMINNQIDKMNSIYPITAGYILSRYHTVN